MLNATNTILSNSTAKTDTFCYYEIIPVQNTSNKYAFPEIEDRGDGLNVFINVKKANFLKFYIWGGNDRNYANKVIISGNGEG